MTDLLPPSSEPGTHAAPRASFSERVVSRVADVLGGRRDSRRGFLAKTAVIGSALAVQPWDFVTAASSLESLPKMHGIEIAFAGRSNVGKSSLINALTGRNALARTSHTPGRTQELIFFAGPAPPILVDMPGYGYAAAAKSKVKAWTALIHDFLKGRANLVRAVYDCL